MTPLAARSQHVILTLFVSLKHSRPRRRSASRNWRFKLIGAYGFLRYISTRKAHELLAEGIASREHLNGEEVIRIYDISVPDFIARNLKSTYTHGVITHRDAMNNITGQQDPATRHRGYGKHIIGNHIDASMSKIEAWPYIGQPLVRASNTAGK